MNTFTRSSMPLKLFGAVLSLALIAVAALVVTPITQAEGTDDTTPATPTQNNYPDPQPCGEGASKANLPEPHEITSGHFALFDSYWRVTFRATVDDAHDTGVLHTNLCPPLVTQTTETQGQHTITVTTRSAREEGMDIDEAIMHVLDKHKVTVVATNAEATDGQLSLQEYPELRKALGIGKDDPVPTGTQVWWLRLDDPDTADKDETSDLSLGFSTALFDDDHWLTSAEGKPMRYKFEVERFPGSNPADLPHFFAYEAPLSGNAEQEAVWSSIRPDIDDDDMTLDPGEYRALQWIFTRPGTYLLSVHLQGFVRKTAPDGAGDDWKRISGNETETGEVKQYSIQVGTELDENEPPVFGINLTVSENSPANTPVGAPIPIFEADADTLYYSLSGDGHGYFALESTTNPHAVQIKVASGAKLDYETKPTYELTLSVTDKLDHESNPDLTTDDTLAVRIGLEDQAPGLVLYPDPNWESVPVGETVRLLALYEPTEARRDETFVYEWAELIQENGTPLWRAISLDEAPSAPSWSVSKSTQAVRTYRVSVVFSMSDVIPPPRLESNQVQVRWLND